ncbi:MAG: 50S ribosomal protein L22 [Candidatus Nanohaloarchaeota archaeon QJJ-7]|nr:50S ribosomal protein L22 [Candidatus Nanohaloarchaeota archaeon QJJ-7]
MEVQEEEAVARGENLPISRKHAREVGEFIKGESVEEAKQKLDRVTEEEQAVPYTRHDAEQSHRKGSMDSGRYPVKTAEEMLELLQSAESNARYEGMNTDNLKVTGVMINQGNRMLTPKRHRGRKAKAAHVTIKVGEKV